MSGNILLLSKDLMVKWIEELVKNSAEETPNVMLDDEADEEHSAM